MEEKILNKLQELTILTVLAQKKVLTMNDVSLLTGLSKSHLYKLCCAKKIPYYKGTGGKHSYFERDEINAWMLQNRVKTNDELETAAATYCVTGKRKGVAV